MTGVFTALRKWDEYLGSIGFLALWPRKTEVAIMVSVTYRVLCKRTSCKYFLLSSFWFFCCFYSTLQSGFRAKYSVTFISDSENAHGFSPNYILQLEGNCRASGNCTIYFSVKWEEIDLGLGSLPEVNVGLAMHWTDTLTLIFQWLTQTPMWFSKMEAEWKCLKWNT